MKSLYLRIWLTVVATLALFAIGAGWLATQEVQRERTRHESQVGERIAAWGELIQRSLPPADAPAEEQANALREWSQRLRLPLALDAADGARIGASEAYLRRSAELGSARGLPVRLEDGRTLWVLRVPPGMRQGPGGMAQGPRSGPGPGGLAPPWLRGTGLVLLLALLFLAVAASAYPVVRRLTRRLEALQQGVERFGAGALGQRVDASGRDEVARLAASFNDAAARIEALVGSHKSLLANASHELRSPLARMKMALSLHAETTDPAQRERLARELRTSIGELDALVEEVLLASRIDAQAAAFAPQPVELISLAAEEAAQVGAELQASDARLVARGDERLLRRALRNLLENARRYGGDEVTLEARRVGPTVELRVCDRGPGVPEALRERIFEPFFRLPGHAEREGGVGLGLSLVKQIAARHGGRVHCEARDGGGSCFVLGLPAA
ncbi:MAG TPA: HAMP domain-containing sensor histidine kinase [Burkholderiaceae bacterium]|nr:HAMP domain-containing sensor histidine kinase [Burkholderiaceae bacterium]